jgi:hypothetical protein
MDVYKIVEFLRSSAWAFFGEMLGTKFAFDARSTNASPQDSSRMAPIYLNYTAVTSLLHWQSIVL